MTKLELLIFCIGIIASYWGIIWWVGKESGGGEDDT